MMRYTSSTEGTRTTKFSHLRNPLALSGDLAVRVFLGFIIFISVQCKDASESEEDVTATFHNASSARQLAEEVNFISPYTYVCMESVCKKQLATPTSPKISLNVCWLTCGKYGALWPFPTIKAQFGYETVSFYPQHVEIVERNTPSSETVKAMLGYAGNVFLDSLFRMHPKSEGQSAFPLTSDGKGYENNKLTVKLTAYGDDTTMTLNTDESYSLQVTKVSNGRGGIFVQATIHAPTYFGCRHALETLLQLVAFDHENECLQIVSSAVIEDRPAFRYRGLMIDTSRNFIPLRSLKRMVDAMSYNKLNMLHLHLTDTNSFPVFSKRIPQMTAYGAYSASEVYSPKDLRELVLYARLRGVKVIPELDAPAHAGNGWQWGPLMGIGELALCVNAEPWRSYCGQPPCGQLNPVNNFTYVVLGELYRDFLEIFDRDIFHMGGDEVFFQCWNSRIEIREWLRSHGTSDLMDLWGHFQAKAFQKLIDANQGQYIAPIVWTSDMTNRARQYLSPQDYIIQIWTGGTNHEVRELLQEKYRVIFSNLDALYLDHGFGTWLGNDHFWKIKTWQNLYDNDLIKLVEYHVGTNATYYAITSGQILGGEATLWSEKVDHNNMEMKLWPRSAAFAERMWSSPQNRTGTVATRLSHHAQRMTDRGILVNRLQPKSCQQLAGYCEDPHSPI